MHFLFTFVFSALLWTSGTIAATLPVGGCAGGDAIEININMQHPSSILKGVNKVWVSERLFFQC